MSHEKTNFKVKKKIYRIIQHKVNPYLLNLLFWFHFQIYILLYIICKNVKNQCQLEHYFDIIPT